MSIVLGKQYKIKGYTNQQLVDLLKLDVQTAVTEAKALYPRASIKFYLTPGAYSRLKGVQHLCSDFLYFEANAGVLNRVGAMFSLPCYSTVFNLTKDFYGMADGNFKFQVEFN